jgi:uncharacterized damage-inducible protein DinB
MTDSLPEPWLRGPIEGIPALLQPAAHALVMAVEDVVRATEGLPADDLWSEPSGAASVGFHLTHLSGATDRLLSYARGERLSDAQKRQLAAERSVPEARPGLETLIEDWRSTVAAAMRQLSRTSEESLPTPRVVGRAQLPSTVLGLLFHAAEHASPHTGQVVTTCTFRRASREGPAAR